MFTNPNLSCNSRGAPMIRPLLVTAVVGSLALAAPAYAVDLPPQEPGVTMRTYDIGLPLNSICELKPGQTPNVDKLMQTVDWSTAEQFGFEDNFVTHALANLTVPSDGSYVFRLTSDDGSTLYIDDKL